MDVTLALIAWLDRVGRPGSADESMGWPSADAKDGAAADGWPAGATGGVPVAAGATFFAGYRR